MGFNQIINKYSNYIFIIGNISVFKLNVIKYHLIKNNTSPKFNNLAKDQAWWMRMGTWLHGFINARFFGCKIFFLYIQKPKKEKEKRERERKKQFRRGEVLSTSCTFQFYFSHDGKHTGQKRERDLFSQWHVRLLLDLKDQKLIILFYFT